MTQVKNNADYQTVIKLEKMSRTKLSEREQLYVDMFLLSCYTGGPTIYELGLMSQSSLKDRMLSYDHICSPSRATVPLMSQAELIINKYREKCFEDYLLPIFSCKHTSRQQKAGRIKRLTDNINKTLQRVCKQTDISFGASRCIYIERCFAIGISPLLVAEHVGVSKATIIRYFLEWDNKTNSIYNNEAGKLLKQC